MYSKASLEDVDGNDIDGIEPTLKAVGYELRPDEMRPSVWEYDENESNNRHYQEEQEELYLVLSGAFRMEIGEEEIEVEEEEFVVVEPGVDRKLTALESSRLFVVGAPNVKDDGVVVE